MAARLEAATKRYGSLILLSESIVKLMSVRIADQCRTIDHLILPGGSIPFKLYTIDLDDLSLEQEKELPPQNKNQKLKARIMRQRRRMERWADEYQIHTLFEDDGDIVTMRARYTEEFFRRFAMAVLNYEAGEWAVAHDMLAATRFMLATEDGPSSALLKYMSRYNFKAPRKWPGYRVFND
eukprot:gnl/TRDRNA2_/TRDRNA2_164633_c0_seq1.p1 gnl/TRDRNA2_/TRDRNA2_164633_c0~~gnl/TRDRNA2_/TRDRNA2_164633_c0_seq1.p1  ORF type:complete len:205 (+),score=28.53 gnl/TRDRNA2_/TRDRNA2_164633_c0_seq1:75-617(+)